MVLFFVVLTAALGLYMAWNIGANDVANSMADAVGSKSCSLKQAIVMAGICEFAGAVLVGSHVTETVRKGIVSLDTIEKLPGVSPEQAAALLAIGMMSALLAAALWLNIATWLGMPVSTTHSIVGAVAGFGVVAAGWSAVQWGTMGEIVASWFISPVVGGALGFILFKVISVLILGRDRPATAAIKVTPFVVGFIFFIIVMAIVNKGLKHVLKLERMAWLTPKVTLLIAAAVAILSAIVSYAVLHRRLRDRSRESIGAQLDLVERCFAPLVFFTSCTVAFAHGANDVANAVGPLAAVVSILQEGIVGTTVNIPLWVLILGGVGIVMGLTTFGYRVMLTVGSKITSITPSRGVAADTATMATVIVCSLKGLPVSTTHTLVGAILGVAMARGVGSVNKQVTRNIFGSWLITVPAAAVLAIIFFLIGRLFLLDTVTQLLPRA